MEPTLVTWLLVAFGVITLTPLTVIYGIFLRDPYAPKAKDLMIGEGKEWKDRLSLVYVWAHSHCEELVVIPRHAPSGGRRAWGSFSSH